MLRSIFISDLGLKFSFSVMPLSDFDIRVMLIWNCPPSFVLWVAFLPRNKPLLISWRQSPSAVILEPKKVSHCLHCFSIYLPWSDGTRCHELSFFECWVLSQLFQSPLSPSSRGSLVPFPFLPLGWCHLHIWHYWYFSCQSWYQLVLRPVRHFTRCTLHKS